jgi:hypothetical protein
MVRTTLTLDTDVAALLIRVRAARKLGLKQTVNEALRLGLQRMSAPAPKRQRYRMQPVSLGECLVGSLDRTAEVLAIAEGEDYR